MGSAHIRLERGVAAAGQEPEIPLLEPVPLLEPGENNIEHILYINLERRADRRDHITKELASLSIPQHQITRVAAMDARCCDESPSVCCARSHILALNKAIGCGWEAVLILEDDFKLLQSPKVTCERWATFLRQCPDFEVASWAHNCLRPWDKYTNGDVRVWSLQTTSAYVVRKSAMSRLRDIYVEAIARGRPFDRHMTNITDQVLWYALRPPLSKQMPSFSDIEHKQVDYGC